MRLGSVVNDQVITKLIGDPDRGRDVVCPVAVLPPRDLLAENQAERFQLQVALDRLALRLWLALLGVDALKVIGGRDERAADDGGGSEPGTRGLLLLAVDPLRVLAERRLHTRRRPERHLVDRSAP